MWDESEETGELSLEERAGEGVVEDDEWVIGEDGTRTRAGASMELMSPVCAAQQQQREEMQTR